MHIELGTSPAPEKHRQPIIGIWLMIVTPDRQLFAFRNLKSKYTSQKVTGQINSPAETFEREKDEKKVKPNGINRAIQEEIGKLKYDPRKVTPLGIIRFTGLDKPVVALPYLIEVPSRDCLQYSPNDDQGQESDQPQWLDLGHINPHATLKVLDQEIPLYRTPMAEIIEMVNGHLSQTPYNKTRHVQAMIAKSFYEKLEAESSTDHTSSQNRQA